MCAADYPKVAIVSMNPIRGDQCNGMLMKSLFQGWPREQLAQIYFPNVVNWLPDTAICGDYRTIRPWGKVRCHSIPSSVAQESSTFDSIRTNRTGSLIRRTVASMTGRQRLMKWLRPFAELWSANFPLSRILERQLRELRPDCVYALLGNYQLTKTVYLACSRLNLPLFTHVSDDFVTAQYEGMHLGSTLQRLSQLWFRRVVDYSRGLAAISPIMAEEFTNRYGKMWTWYTTGISPNEYKTSPRQPDGTIRLVYSGNLGLERWQTLRTLALALESLSKRSSMQLRLAIYAPESQLSAYGAALNLPPVVELRGWKQPAELPSVFHESDILVHVESCNPTIAAYTRLSFSTKLSQYMMAGRCLLAVGPNEAGSMRMVSRVGAGVVTDEMEPSALAKAIEPIIRGQEQRQAFADRGRQWALEHCDRLSAQDRFRQELGAIVSRHRLQEFSRRAA